MRLTERRCFIVPCVTLADMDVYPDAVRSQAERTMAVQSVALACQNLLLAARRRAGRLLDVRRSSMLPALVRQALELPEDWGRRPS